MVYYVLIKIQVIPCDSCVLVFTFHSNINNTLQNVKHIFFFNVDAFNELVLDSVGFAHT